MVQLGTGIYIRNESLYSLDLESIYGIRVYTARNWKLYTEQEFIQLGTGNYIQNKSLYSLELKTIHRTRIYTARNWNLYTEQEFIQLGNGNLYTEQEFIQLGTIYIRNKSLYSQELETIYGTKVY